MIFIINETPNPMSLAVKEIGNGYTDLCLNVNGNDMEATLFRTSDPAVATAFNKRFPSGKTNLPNRVNRHYFLASGSHVVMEFPEDIRRSPIMMITVDDRAQVKNYPKNLILIVSESSADLKAGLDDERNIEREFSVDAGDYRFTYVVPKWANWGGLKYRAVVNVGDEVFELTSEVPVGSKYPQNALVMLTPEQVEEYRAYRVKVQEEFEARRKQIEEKKQQRPANPAQKKPNYNNRSDGRTQTPQKPHPAKDYSIGTSVGDMLAGGNNSTRGKRQPRPNGKKARKAAMAQAKGKR